jgi:hypothetical protein
VSPRLTAASTLLLAGTLACGSSDLRFFDVTIRTVRSCHPAGLLSELCEDPSSFRGRTRTARLTVEFLGPTEFILYDDEGRSLPGRWQRDGFLERELVEQRQPPVRRQYYFGRQWDGTRDAAGCQKESERNVKFRLERDLTARLGETPGPVRVVGTFQDRATQDIACGQATTTRLEEAFEGVEVDGAAPPALPGLPALPGGPLP